MEPDTREQKIDTKETIQALLVVYNRPNLIRSQVGSASISYLFFNSFLNAHN